MLEYIPQKKEPHIGMVGIIRVREFQAACIFTQYMPAVSEQRAEWQ